MATPNDEYQTPFNSRYCSKQMKQLFSPRRRFSTWRQLWTWLAESEKELGLEISEEAITQMQKHIEIQDEEFPFIWVQHPAIVQITLTSFSFETDSTYFFQGSQWSFTSCRTSPANGRTNLVLGIHMDSPLN